MLKIKDREKLLEAVVNSSIFKLVKPHDEIRTTLDLNVVYWDFYLYQDSFAFAFNINSQRVVVIDFKINPNYQHTHVTDSEMLFERSSGDLKDFIIFNLDLFQ
jgi:hypothetical protein